MLYFKLSRWAFFAKGKVPNPREQVSDLFFCIFASLTSNISGSRQNIKNQAGNFLGKGSSYLHAKSWLSSFISEGTFQVTDGHRKII